MENISIAKKEIGANIKRERISLKKEVKEVCKDLDISSAAYSNIERGITDISISRLIQISEYFDISISQIMPLFDNNYYFTTKGENKLNLNINGQFSNIQNVEFTKAIRYILNENEFLILQNATLIRRLSIK